jgi:hypothetical protein
MPNTLAVPVTSPCTPHIYHAQVHSAGHRVTISDDSWRMHFEDMGVATMPIQHAHPILTLQPVNPPHIAHLDYRQIILHNDHPYEPPTYGDVSDYRSIDLDAMCQAATMTPKSR